MIIGLNKEIKEHIDAKVNYSKDFAIKEPSYLPIIQEQIRGEKDKYFVETNSFLAILDCHMNLLLIMSIDMAIPVEDYLTDYTTKISIAEIFFIAFTMLAGMNFCKEHKSKADNTDSDIRKYKYFTERTIDSFQRKIQYEVKL